MHIKLKTQHDTDEFTNTFNQMITRDVRLHNRDMSGS